MAEAEEVEVSIADASPSSVAAAQTRWKPGRETNRLPRVTASPARP